MDIEKILLGLIVKALPYTLGPIDVDIAGEKLPVTLTIGKPATE